jgi:aminoglycoside phosphotransferase family enzyme/predicted kinase
MDLAQLIDALSRPAAYPFIVDRVEVRQTHISVVFLAGGFAYKVRKPVALGFLDFSTLDRRRRDCDEEVRLNRRLAPAVYQGVVPVTQVSGKVQAEGAGEAVEWAVKMERLPDDATLLSRLRRGAVDRAEVEALARTVAGFHARAEGGERVAAFGRFAVVAGNARENFEQSAPQVGTTISRAVFDRLRALTEAALERHRPLIEARAARGVPRDTHGDLHLDHIYRFPDRPPPADWVVIDCVEFNERFRFADPVADAAFLVMDLAYRGRRDLAGAFADAYFRAAGDADGRALLPFYVAYRAAVRGKVEGFKAAEAEVPDTEKAAARAAARAHWLLVLGELEEPGGRPGLVLVGGLPGTGKSTLAHGLAARAGFTVIRSDDVRKGLAGLAPLTPAPAALRTGLYAPDWTERTYAECRRRAEAALADGQRVIVDATFGDDARRQSFMELAAGLAVPVVVILCHAAPETVQARLAARRGDASDADWGVYQAAARAWQDPGPAVRPHCAAAATDGPQDAAVTQALARLAAAGLH